LAFNHTNKGRLLYR